MKPKLTPEILAQVIAAKICEHGRPLKELFLGKTKMEEKKTLEERHRTEVGIIVGQIGLCSEYFGNLKELLKYAEEEFRVFNPDKLIIQERVQEILEKYSDKNLVANLEEFLREKSARSPQFMPAKPEEKPPPNQLSIFDSPQPPDHGIKE